MRRLFLLAMMLAAGPALSGAGEPRDLKPAMALARAEELYRQDKLSEAEPFYRQALSGPAERRQSYDRLLAIYVRLGRQDRAIDLGLDYQRWLREAKESDRMRHLELELGWCYFTLGHLASAEKHLRAAVEGPGPQLPAHRRLTALVHLALIAQKQDRRDRAAQIWLEVEKTALAGLEDATLSRAERLECLAKLSASYAERKDHKRAIEKLKSHLAELDEGDAAARRDVCRLLAQQLFLVKDLKGCADYLRRARAESDKLSVPDRLAQGDLAADLSELCRAQGKTKESDQHRAEAAEHYGAVIKSPGLGHPGVAGAVTAFWKLQALYRAAQQHRSALGLVVSQADHWATAHLLAPKLQAERGGLEFLVGSQAAARKLLADALAHLERQSTPNLYELPRVLNNLAGVSLTTEDFREAALLAQRCLDLYSRYALPLDAVLIESHNLLGVCSAQEGRYAAAVDRFREGLKLCEQLGLAADAVRGNILLNLALLHKAQGDYEPAFALCREAREVHERLADPDALSLAAFDAALVSLLVAQAKIKEAQPIAARVLEVCRKHEIKQGVLLVTARHAQALHLLHQREVAAAEAAWKEVLEIQETEKQALLLPRTLNYLALSAELRGDWARAEELLRRAAGLQKANPRAFPVTHFITLWRLAHVATKVGKASEARGLLTRAISVVEKARLQTYGDAQQRAGFFAQFAPAFDDLVERCLAEGDVEAALLASSRGRSRTLLDQLQTSGVDPRVGLPADAASRLLTREAQLREKISALRARAVLMAADMIETPAGQKLIAAFEQAQADYAEVWREILNASPVYRELADEESGARALAMLRAGALKRGQGLLLFHLGRERAFAFLLTGETLDVFALEVPAEVASRLALPPPLAAETMLAGGRGLVLVAAEGKDLPPAPEARPAGPVVPLGAQTARALVEHYLRHVMDPRFEPTRGLTLKSVDAREPLPPQRPDLPGNILVPPGLRKRIKAAALGCLVVVPDGPLHRLPLEALIIEGSPGARYLHDELPPTVYAPSLSILALLMSRPGPAGGPLSLLTVGDPLYPKGKGKPKEAPAHSLLALHGGLPPLPGSAIESKRIAALFAKDRVLTLHGVDATERKAVTAMADRKVIHIAAHGFADERFGNLFGALALAPPAGKAGPEDDGFLALHEIFQLPLQRCELAVLSACVTNVGPQKPLEAGVTLAHGFLVAGARRVVASHWSVDDRSTAEMMEAFFKRVTASAGAGTSLGAAHALHSARHAIRSEPRWQRPFFWAPFVVVGPPD